MGKDEFVTLFKALWDDYVLWLDNSQDVTYGVQGSTGAYGGGIEPTTEGFIRWILTVYQLSQ